MLINSFEHTVDAKGRLFIPAKWRDDLGGTVIVTPALTRKGDYQCLLGMSVERWNAFVERVKSVSLANVKLQKALRQVFSMACECEVDKQGRILIDPALRTLSSLDKDVTLIGMGDHIEFWQSESWKVSMAEVDGFDDETLDALTELRI